MPKNRKYFPHKGVLLISARTEEGLPMPPNHVMNFLIWGILAEASSRYRVKICHLLFMSNHLHMLVVVDDPADVSAFMRYVKSETSHAVNRLIGRTKRTIWCEGYDSPLLLSSEKIIHYIKYIYLNPAKANLVESIEEYPGVSTWKMFISGENSLSHTRVPRPEIRALHTPALSVSEQRELVARWKLLPLKEKDFSLEPWAWLECFPGHEKAEVYSRIIAEVEEEEYGYRKQRQKEKKSVLGPTALRRQSMTKEYEPTKRSRRMIVLCEDKELRRQFLHFYKSLCSLALAAYERWKFGDFSAQIPPGMFAPRPPLIVSALST